MQQWKVWTSVLCLMTLVGCASQRDVRALRADIQALGPANRTRNTELTQSLQTLEGQAQRLIQSQENARRELGQAVSTTQELRGEFQRLQSDIEEARRQRRDGVESLTEYDTTTAQIEAFQSRLEDLERRLGLTGSSTTTVPTTTEATTTPETPPSLTSDPADNLYHSAMQAQQQGQYDRAIALYRQYLQQYPRATGVAQAQFGIGESLYELEQYEAAIIAFDDVIRKYPKHPSIPAALLKQGLAFAELQDTPNAEYFLHQVVRQYPESPEAKQAEAKLRRL